MPMEDVLFMKMLLEFHSTLIYLHTQSTQVNKGVNVIDSATGTIRKAVNDSEICSKIKKILVKLI